MEQDTVKVVKRTIGLVLILAAAMGIAGILLEIFGSPWGASRGAEGCPGICRTNLPGAGVSGGRGRIQSVCAWL